MSKVITIFLASPRSNGNSDKLAYAFIEGAKSVGHIVNEVIIRDLNINGCLGCEYCYEHNGECIQNDDMKQIYETLANTEVIVFATPIYYQAFPSQLKAVIDRLYVTENRYLPITESILLTTYATCDSSMEKLTILYYEALIKYHEWKNLGIISVACLDDRNDIIGNTALDSAYKLGVNLENL